MLNSFCITHLSPPQDELDALDTDTLANTVQPEVLEGVAALCDAFFFFLFFVLLF